MTVISQLKNKQTSLIYAAKFPRNRQNRQTTLDNLCLEIYNNFFRKHPEFSGFNTPETKIIILKKIKLSLSMFLNESETSLESFFNELLQHEIDSFIAD